MIAAFDGQFRWFCYLVGRIVGSEITPTRGQ
jgi:hypothetical protein